MGMGLPEGTVLDIGGQQCRTLQRLGGFAHSAPDRGRRSVAVALRQPQQPTARLGLEPAAARLAVRGFSRVELAAQPMDLALSVAGSAVSTGVSVVGTVVETGASVALVDAFEWMVARASSSDLRCGGASRA